MSIHDAYARRTPIELAFPDRRAAVSAFEAIAEEAGAREGEPSDPAAFMQLAAVGQALRALGGPEAGSRVHELGALLFHLYHVWRAGDLIFLLDLGVARMLADTESWEARRPDPRSAGGYLQLPQHLFWMGGGGEPLESVDGLFWTRVGGSLWLLLIAGIRPDRPGFTVVPLGPVPLDEVGPWSDLAVREDGGRDFQSELPGAGLDGLYELRTGGEVLKLGARALLLLEQAGTEAVRVESGLAPSPEDGRTPEPSELAYLRVTLSSIDAT